MPTIRKRGPKQWQAQVRRRGFPTQTKTFRTSAAADRWAQSIESEIGQGAFVSRMEAEHTTLADLLQRYRDEVTPIKKGAAAETIRLNAFQRCSLAPRFIATIRSVDIAKYRNERLAHVSSATVRRDLGVLSHVFEIARKEWGIHVPNPVRDIRMPPNGKARDRRLNRAHDGAVDEEARLLRACAEAHNKLLLPLVLLALETAMRQSELINLRWEHIDLARRTAHLPVTKNGESRTVPLSAKAIVVLKALGHVAGHRPFRAMTGEAAKRSFIRAAKRANLDDFHFHDLRHEATTRFFEIGLNIMEVATITGHKDLRMLRRYTHLHAEELAKKLPDDTQIST